MISVINLIKNKIGSKKLILVILLAVFLVVVYLFFWRSGREDVTSYKVDSTDISQTVSVSGETKASSYVDLAFDQSGVVTTVGALVGEKVYQGQLMVGLDNGKARADLLAAEASADYQRAKLADSQVSLSDADKNLDDSLRDAFTKADDAISNYADKFFKNSNTSSPTFELFFKDGNNTVYFKISDSKLEQDINNQRSSLVSDLAKWKQDLSSNNVFLADKENASTVTVARLEKVRKLLDNLASAVNSFSSDKYEYLATVNGYKSDIATARTNISTAINNLNNSKQAWNTARLSAATSNEGVISTQSAQIKQAEADVASKRAVLAKLSLLAPISGVVTKQEAKVGEAVTAGEVVVSILNPDSFEVEANIPEINIGKIKVGQKTKITLDAFPGEAFSGEVFYIDPAETIVDGVVNYKVKVAFKDKDARFKNGLTANLIIITDSKEGVLAVPVYAITTDKGLSTVKKYVNGQAVATPVKLGVYGDNGLVEVIDGLNVGDSLEVKTK